jgi:hypothetical protein
LTGLALVSLMTGFLLVYSGFKALDPRCLVTKAFNPDKDCPRIDADEPSPTEGIFPSGTSTSTGGGLPGTKNDGTWNWTFDNSAANQVKANAAYLAIKARFPGIRYGGICNCRKRRGGGADTTQWSVHSVCGAVDIWPESYSPNSIIALAKSIPGVFDAYLDSPPGDVHVQVVPNPPHNWIPPCARRGAQ